MPLFGRKRHDKNVSDNAGYDDTTAPGVTGSAGGGGNKLHKNQHPQSDPTYPSSNAPGAGGYSTQQERGTGGGFEGGGHQGAYSTQGNDPYVHDGGYGGGGGVSAGQPGYAGAAHHAMPPQTDMRGNPAHPGGGGGSRFAGKVESAVGTMLGSENLKRKGMEKEQESQALKVQAAELSEAERLEQEALARRSRAVAHGAHPDHKHLGSHNPGAGAPNVNELGGGANYGVSGAGSAGSAGRGGY